LASDSLLAGDHQKAPIAFKMSTRTDSLSRQELAAASSIERIAAAFFGRAGFDALKADAFKIAIPFLLDIDALERDALAVCEAKEEAKKQKRKFNETAESRRTEQLLAVAAMLGADDIAEMKKKAEVDVLALMKEAAQTHNASKLRSIADVLDMPGKEHHDPLRAYLLSVKHRPGTKTAQEVQAAIKTQYRFADGRIPPTAYHVARVARELGVQLAKLKPGAPRGTYRKSVHRARKQICTIPGECC
jgi:hypothetical protein